LEELKLFIVNFRIIQTHYRVLVTITHDYFEHNIIENKEGEIIRKKKKLSDNPSSTVILILNVIINMYNKTYLFNVSKS